MSPFVNNLAYAECNLVRVNWTQITKKTDLLIKLKRKYKSSCGRGAGEPGARIGRRREWWVGSRGFACWENRSNSMKPGKIGIWVCIIPGFHLLNPPPPSSFLHIHFYLLLLLLTFWICGDSSTNRERKRARENERKKDPYPAGMIHVFSLLFFFFIRLGVGFILKL